MGSFLRTTAVTLSVLVGAGAALAGSQTGAVRATLIGPSGSHALGVFTGTLTGSTLRWRLSHHGLGPSASSARLLVAGRDVRLCAPCAAFRAGSVALTPAETRAARAGRASVLLRGAPGTVSGKLVLGTVPTIQVDVSDGARLHLPAVVHYTVTGAPASTQVVADNGGARVATARSAAPSGTIVLPDDKRLTGRRDLTFSLVDASGTLLPNVEASARVYGVILAGRR